MNQRKLAAARQSRFRYQFRELNRHFHFRHSLDSNTITFSYDDRGQQVQETLTTHGQYFADNQIQTIATPTVETLTYTYDGNKNPTSEARSGVMAPYSWTTGPTGYDDEDRLVVWTRTNGDSQTWNLSPVHDWNSTVINGATQTRTHGPAHEILTMAGAGVSPTPATLAHDTKGNMTTDDRGTNMAWDFDNMLQTFTANGVTDLSNATYEYDAIGRRVAKNVAQSGGGTKSTVYVLSGDDVIVDDAVFADQTACTYIFGSLVDDRLMAAYTHISSRTLYWYCSNKIGTLVAVTTANGSAISTFDNVPYGSQVAVVQSGLPATLLSSALPCKYPLAGRELDMDTLYFYLRTRMHSPTLGRMLSRDTVGYWDGTSLYSYAGSNPIRYSDPYGQTKGGEQNICPSFVDMYRRFDVKYLEDLLKELLKDPRKNAASIRKLRGWLKVVKRGGFIALPALRFMAVCSMALVVTCELDYHYEYLDEYECNSTCAQNSCAYKALQEANEMTNRWIDAETEPRACANADAILRYNACFRSFRDQVQSSYYLACEGRGGGNINAAAKALQECTDNACPKWNSWHEQSP